MMRRQKRRVLTAGGLLLLCGVSWLHQNFYDLQADDAFISYRYAANWAAGHGPVFNTGERVEGYSNFLLVALLALVRRAGGDVVHASRTLGTLACWALLVAMYLQLRRGFRRGTGLALAGSAALALHAGISTFARSGLEAIPLVLTVLLAQSIFLEDCRRGRSHVRAGLLFGVIALLRADGFVFCAATALFLVSTRRGWREVWSLAWPFGVVFVPYFAWRWSYYGFLLPNPYYLRTGGDIYQQLRGLFYLAKFVVPFGGVLLFGLPLLLLTLRDPERDRDRLYLATCVATVAGYVVWVGGDHMPMGRFLLPVVPALTILILEAVHEIAVHVRASGRVASGRNEALQAVLVGLVLLSGFLPTLNPRREPHSHVIESRTQAEQWSLAGRWLAAHVDPSTVLATDAVGALSYYSGLRIVDMLGVTDRHIAHLRIANMGHGTAAHEKRDFDYVLSRRPDLIYRGVVESECAAGLRTTYADGSSYVLRCVALGRRPVADRFGVVREPELFLAYEEREPPSLKE